MRVDHGRRKRGRRPIPSWKRAQLGGLRYGRLSVIESVGVNTRGQLLWLCACDCGAKRVVPSYRLTHGKTKSCGCLAIAIANSKKNRMARLRQIMAINNYFFPHRKSDRGRADPEFLAALKAIQGRPTQKW